MSRMSRILQTSVMVHEQCTELVVQSFADRILVLVTQMGKVGSMIQVSIPSTTDLHTHALLNASELPSPSPAIQLTPIFGSAPSADMQTLYSLYAAQIATLVWLANEGEPRGVIVGIALEKDERKQETFHTVMQALKTLLSH